jgi:hypothetical protein
MKLLARSQTPFKHSTSLLEWHRSLAWYPVPGVIKGKLRYGWLRFVERKWGASRYSGTMKMALSPPYALTNAIDGIAANIAKLPKLLRKP